MGLPLFLRILSMSTDYPFLMIPCVMRSKLFRFCDLGSSLSDVLKEMVEEKKLSSVQMESILKCYDKVFLNGRCEN